MVPKPQVGQESQPKHGRRNSKGSLNGKANAMRRAASMFSVNTAVEEQSQDLNLLSKKSQGPNLQQVKKAPEAIITHSRKKQEASYTLPKTSPEISWRDRDKNTQRRPSRTSEDSDSQPLARSFIPRDYQHYLGITEDRSMYTPPPVKEQVDDLICTSFTSSPETHRSCKCSPVKTSTPVQGSPDLQTRRGSLGCDSTTQTDGNATKGNLTREIESPIQKALRRASSRPVFHKSMEDISTLPRQDQKQANDYMQSNYDDSSTLVQTSFATSDPVHLKQLSKSVPSFLQKESDGGESDSESSSRSGVPQWNNRQFTDFSNYSGSPSLSSVSGSVVSVYNSDYSSVDVQGSIQFSLNYVHKLREFHIFVVQCQNLAAVDTKRNRSDPYVKSYLIPDPANLGKRKTAVKKKTLNPTYNEILRYRVRMEYLTSQVLNLSAWHNDTFGRNSFLGEIELDLSSWDFNDTEWKLLPLKPRTTNSLQPSDLRGQMRLAVRFLPQISQSKNTPGSGEVHIWVKDCKNLPLIRSPAIDPYVKCFVLPDTSKKSRQKTRVLKRTVNPVFNHTMVYDGFRAEDLKEACVELTVWDRDRLANHLLGGLRLGMGTGKSYGVQVDWMDSTAEEVALWRRMMESPNEWVESMLPLRMVTAAKNTWK
ncbi:synaptotagmin-like protein 2 isoform X2 [Carassius carassius]|uniref:synaptotagmin-like protein 2 isoform X2 n=1 Tax=Carassius carassius TaxID=217509 RepID=UPI00286877AC|nr:synaptotagmin-like protein 2 isoform X2 [Carassius carassius]